MATYICSDIHGMYDMFLKMIEKIDFKEDDILYIIGDIVDRGPNSYDIYQYVISHPNIYMLRGNHEQMMIDYVRRKDPNWFFNGGYKTLSSIPHKASRDLDVKMKEMADYFDTLPYYIRIEVNNTKYLLVHAGIRYGLPIEKQSKMDLLWIREDFLYDDQEVPEGIVLFGHTPNRHFQMNVENKDAIAYFQYKIGMDGGACFGGQLNCLRLDDLVDFEVLQE